MNDKSEQLKKNFLDQWIRLAFVALYVVVFALLWRFIALLLLVVIILHSLYKVIAAENNSHLLVFSEGLCNVLLTVLQYVLYLSDEKPIDFDAFFSKKETSQAEATQSGAEAVAPAKTADQPADEKPKTDARQADDDVFDDISFTDRPDADDDGQEKKDD